MPPSRYPSSDIDLAFVVPDDVPAAAVRATIAEAAGPLLASSRLFDVFRSEALAAGTRSLAFSLRLQADDHTLTDDEVGQLRAQRDRGGRDGARGHAARLRQAGRHERRRARA